MKLPKSKVYYPPGAVRYFKELRDAKAPVMYLVMGEGIMKFSECKRDRRRKPFKPLYRGYNFYRDGRCIANLWTPASEFVFEDGRVFTNYWYAHVYMERLKQGDQLKRSA